MGIAYTHSLLQALGDQGLGIHKYPARSRQLQVPKCYDLAILSTKVALVLYKITWVLVETSNSLDMLHMACDKLSLLAYKC